MKKKLFIVSLGLICMASFAFAGITVDFTAPKAKVKVDGEFSAFEDEFNSLIGEAVNELTGELDAQLQGFDADPVKLAKGFSNAAAYASNAAGLNSFQGYKLFGIQAGFMAGAQLPSLDLAYFENFSDSLLEDPDMYAGLAIAAPVFNVGVNIGTLLNTMGLTSFKGFSANLKFGSDFGLFDSGLALIEGIDASFKTSTLGLGLNYQLIKPIGLGGFFKWRGLSLGSGLTWQHSTIGVGLPLGEITAESFEADDIKVTAKVNPDLRLNIDSNVFVIPFEVATSLQLLWVFNVSAGAGVDLMFGKTIISANVESPLMLDMNADIPGNIEIEDGYAAIGLTTQGISPSFAGFRLMVGVGTNIGPLKLDVPFYYYLDTGLAFGLTLGFVW